MKITVNGHVIEGSVAELSQLLGKLGTVSSQPTEKKNGNVILRKGNEAIQTKPVSNTEEILASLPTSLTEEEFTLQAIGACRGEYSGINAVFSGFNKEFKARFGHDSREVTNRLVEEKKISLRGFVDKRGMKSVYLYFPKQQ